MSKDKESLINLIPEAVDNAAKNLIDKPSQNIGTTLADIWYLVFGGISQAAEKRKLKYSYALQEFENELNEKISKIPKNKLVEPDIQVVAQALEAAKYCVEKEELRHMFVKLISSSLNEDSFEDVHPLYVNIIKSLTPFDAKLLFDLYNKKFEFQFNFADIIYSINVLSQLGLITYEHKHSKTESTNFIQYENPNTNKIVIHFNFNIPVEEIPNVIFTDSNGDRIDISSNSPFSDMKKDMGDIFIDNLHITKLGYSFIRTCI